MTTFSIHIPAGTTVTRGRNNGGGRKGLGIKWDQVRLLGDVIVDDATLSAGGLSYGYQLRLGDPAVYTVAASAVRVLGQAVKA